MTPREEQAWLEGAAYAHIRGAEEMLRCAIGELEGAGAGIAAERAHAAMRISHDVADSLLTALTASARGSRIARERGAVVDDIVHVVHSPGSIMRDMRDMPCIICSSAGSKGEDPKEARQRMNDMNDIIDEVLRTMCCDPERSGRDGAPWRGRPCATCRASFALVQEVRERTQSE